MISLKAWQAAHLHKTCLLQDSASTSSAEYTYDAAATAHGSPHAIVRAPLLGYEVQAVGVIPLTEKREPDYYGDPPNFQQIGKG